MNARALRLVAAAAMTVAAASSSALTTAAAAATGPAVESAVHTVVVDWGPHIDAAQAGAAAGVLDALDNSGYLRGLAAAYALSPRAVYLGAGAVPQSDLPSTVSDASINATLRHQVAAGVLPAPTGATNYVVMLPPGVSSSSFCSSHHSFTIGTQHAYAVVIADYSSTVQQCGGGAQDVAGAASVNVSRQLVNAITDPAAQGTGLTQSGTGAELGTACAAAGASGNVDGFAVQPWWDNAKGTCSFGSTGVNLTPDVARVTNARAATFRLHDTEAVASQPAFACTLDGTAVSCDTSHPLAVTSLAAGSHVVDASVPGVGDAKYAWLVDIAPPTASLLGPSASVKVGRTVTVGYAAHDAGGSGVAAYDVRYRTAAWNGAFRRWVQPPAWQATGSAKVALAVRAGTTYCFSVRAHDRADNVSSWSAARCTSVPVDDSGLTASAGWHRVKAAGAFHRTLSVSSGAGAQLQLAKAHFRQIALVVRTCPSCGRIKVFRGGVLWRTVNTRSARVHNRVVLMLPAAGLRTATIRFKPAGGKSVYVDGVAVLQS